jgi:hypothetical protein
MGVASRSLNRCLGRARIWQERRSTDFIVPLGYCQLISIAFFEFQI